MIYLFFHWHSVCQGHQYAVDDYSNQNEQHTTSSLRTRVQQETLINVQSLIVHITGRLIT